MPTQTAIVPSGPKRDGAAVRLPVDVDGRGAPGGRTVLPSPSGGAARPRPLFSVVRMTATSASGAPGGEDSGGPDVSSVARGSRLAGRAQRGERLGEERDLVRRAGGDAERVRRAERAQRPHDHALPSSASSSAGGVPTRTNTKFATAGPTGSSPCCPERRPRAAPAPRGSPRVGARSRRRRRGSRARPPARRR